MPRNRGKKGRGRGENEVANTSISENASISLTRGRGNSQTIQDIQERIPQSPTMKKRKRDSNEKKETSILEDKSQDEVFYQRLRTSLEEANNLDETTNNHILKNLNRLAWLLNRDTKSCTAVCLVKNKLLISDNDIAGSTRENNPVFIFIQEVLGELTNIVNRFKIEGKIDGKLLANLFSLIFEKKLKGEEAGYLSSIQQYQDEIREGLFKAILTYDSTKHRDRSQRIDFLMQSISSILTKISRGHSYQKVHTAVGLGICIIWRLQEIIPFLASEDANAITLMEALNAMENNFLLDNEEPERPDQDEAPENEHSEEQGNIRRKITVIRYISSKTNPNFMPDQNVQHWLKNDRPGCAILAINKKGTHAELKPIDCLLASRIIGSSSKERPLTIIGISRKCCGNCYIAIIAINDTLSTEGIPALIQVSGTHYMFFKKNWNAKKPYFLIKKSKRGLEEKADKEIIDNPGEISSTSSEAFNQRDQELMKQILKAFDDIEEGVINGKIPCPEPRNFMSHDDSSHRSQNVSFEETSSIRSPASLGTPPANPQRIDSPYPAGMSQLLSSHSEIFQGAISLIPTQDEVLNKFADFQGSIITFTEFFKENQEEAVIYSKETQDKLKEISIFLANCQEMVKEVENIAKTAEPSMKLGHS